MLAKLKTLSLKLDNPCQKLRTPLSLPINCASPSPHISLGEISSLRCRTSLNIVKGTQQKLRDGLDQCDGDKGGQLNIPKPQAIFQHRRGELEPIASMLQRTRILRIKLLWSWALRRAQILRIILMLWS